MARSRFAQSAPALAIARAVVALSVTSIPPAEASATTASSSVFAMNGVPKLSREGDRADGVWAWTAIELKVASLRTA
jgi:hypothetical protein